MNTLEEKRILNALKLAPFGLLFFSIIFILIIIADDYINLKKELNSLEKNYIQEQKVLIKKEVNKVVDYINYEKSNAEKMLKANLKSRVYEAHAIASNLYSKYKETKSQEEITHIIKEALRDIRFNDNRGYYYILTTSNAVNILNGFQPALEGKNLYNLQDSKGKYLNQEIIKIIKDKGEGFVDYFWYKPNTDNKMYKKISFSKEFEPYEFYIGTGEYLTNFEENLKENILNYVSTITYAKNGYVFINSFEGVNLAHIKKSFRGQDFNNLKDPNGVYSVRELNNIAKKGEGYLEYQGQIVPSTGKKGKKISFAKGFNYWSWTIGSGAYLKDIDAVIQERKTIIESQNKNKIIKIVMALLLTIILFFIIAVLISKKISSMFSKYSHDIEDQMIKNQKQKETLIKAQKIAHLGDWKLDLKTNEAFWSNEFLDIFGISKNNKEKFGPDLIKTLIFKEDITCFEQSLNKCIKTSQEHNCTYRISKPDGQIKWINCRGEINEEKTFIIGTVQDITEQKNKDEILINQSRHAAMGEMIGMIAHQWRQPISVISMEANNILVDIGLDTFTVKEAEKYANSINVQTQHLSDTIDDFRNFFKPDKVMSEVNIKETMNSTLSIVKDSLINNNIKLISSFETDKVVQAYPRELMQVLVNLITNSKDALTSNHIDHAKINIRVYEDKKYINTEVCDNGGGIDTKILSKIFDPYFSTKDDKNGTGLGLYISKLIVENHLNGMIEVYNNNEGACFTVKLLKNK